LRRLAGRSASELADEIVAQVTAFATQEMDSPQSSLQKDILLAVFCRKKDVSGSQKTAKQEHSADEPGAQGETDEL
jgi:hypothetical protein